ncbi:MAG: hypothetical protein HFF84_14405 [Oscillibacter sp.]|nr:hypothetical protein [Oscillibacter sp.]
MYHPQDGMEYCQLPCAAAAQELQEQNRLHLTSRYSGFWWEKSQALPWKRLAQNGRLLWLDTPETIRLSPGKTYQLSITLTGFSAGTAAAVFLQLAVPDGAMDIPLFTLRPKGAAVFHRTLPLYTQMPADLSLRVSGPFGICLLGASLEGTAFPV